MTRTKRSQYTSMRALPILLLAVLALAAISTPAKSQEVLSLDIEPQSAGSALVTLAELSGMQIVLSQGAGEKVDVEGLKGEYRFEDALAVLLTDTGLEYQFAAENMVVVQVAEQAAQTGVEEQDTAEEEEQPMELAAQIVTGSRLRDTLSGAPVFVLTREEIDLRGLGSVEDIVRSLPQNFSDVNAGAARDNSINSVDAMGQSMVNLRGYGEEATLVLVNGRRWPQGLQLRERGGQYQRVAVQRHRAGGGSDGRGFRDIRRRRPGRRGELYPA